jgi:hypothetical protein
MLSHVVIVRTNVSEERIASVFRVKRVLLRSVLRSLVNANVVPCSPIHAPLMEKIRPYETSVLTRATRCNIPEDGILRCHNRVNLKSSIALNGELFSGEVMCLL